MTIPAVNLGWKIQQNPKPMPYLGTAIGVNKLFTDPIFGVNAVRGTDVNSGIPGGVSSYFCAGVASTVANIDDTMYQILNGGGGTFLRQFNPATMQSSKLPLSSPFHLNGSVSFSTINPDLVFNAVLRSSQIIALSYKTNPATGLYMPGTSTVVCDFAKILPAGFKINWQSLLSVAQDKVFCMAFSQGVQDTGFLVCLYNSEIGTYRMFNSQTLEVTEIGPVWGNVGKVTLHNTKYTNFFLHGVQMTANPMYCVVSAVGNTTGGFVWPVQDLIMTQPGLAGHHALGFLHGVCPNTSGGQMVQYEYSSPTIHVKLIPDAMLPINQTPKQIMVGDSHSSYAPISPTDESLIWTGWGPPVPDPFTSCWMGEACGLDGSGVITGVPGTVIRLMHTGNSGKSKEYEVMNGQACPSQTGKFIFTTTDWLGAFGSNDSKPVKLGENARGDVIIGQMLAI